MTDEIRAGRNPLRENGALGLVATPEQLEGLHRIQALMSLLEGHGDVTMDRAGAAAIPSAATFSEVLRQRRQQTKGPARLLQQLIGIEAKLRQYEEGERFIAAVEDAGGPELLDRVWRGPEWLPSLVEIRDPRCLDLAVSGPRPPSPAEPAGAHPDRLVEPCSTGVGSRRRHRPGVRGVGRRRLARPAGAGRGRRLPGDRRPRRPRPAARIRRRGPAWWRQPLGVSGRSFRSERVAVGPGPNLEARARQARRPGARPGGGYRPHRRRPGGDGTDQPAARGAGLDGLAGMRPGPPSPPARRPARRDRGAVPPTRPRVRCTTRRNDDPRFRAQPGAPRAAPAAAPTSPGATSCRCSPARPACWPATPTCSTDWPTGSTRRRRRALARSRGRRPAGASGDWLREPDGHPPDARRRRAGAGGGPASGAGRRAGRRPTGAAVGRGRLSRRRPAGPPVSVTAALQYVGP